MSRKTINTLLIFIAATLSAGLGAGQTVLQSELGRRPAATIAVGNHGRVVLAAPDDSGTTLVVVGPKGLKTKHRFEGESLISRRVFPDGRILVVSNASQDSTDSAPRVLILDAKVEKVAWRAPHLDYWSFDATGRWAVWTPCLYCASEMPESAVGKEAAKYLGKGLAIAIENTTRPPTGKFSLLRGPSMEETMRNAGPLDYQVEALSGRRALVILNGVPYVFDGRRLHLELLDRTGEVAPVNRAVAVSPSGNRIWFELYPRRGRGQYAVWDLPSERIIWESDADVPFRKVVERELGVSVSFEESGRLRRWFVGENAVAFLYPGVGVVTFSLNTHRTARPLTWPKGRKLAEPERRPKVSAGLVKIAVSGDGRTVATLDQGEGVVTLGALGSLD
jgi:hypothetical protein